MKMGMKLSCRKTDMEDLWLSYIYIFAINNILSSLEQEKRENWIHNSPFSEPTKTFIVPVYNKVDAKADKELFWNSRKNLFNKQMT